MRALVRARSDPRITAHTSNKASGISHLQRHDDTERRHGEATWNLVAQLRTFPLSAAASSCVSSSGQRESHRLAQPY
eukprot:scaffold8264_cov109-Isochrysis_galbana.AAC.3